MNKVVVVMELQVSLWQGMKFSGYLPRNEIVGLYGSSVLILRILQTDFYNGILTCSPTKVNNPYPLQQLLEMLKIVSHSVVSISLMTGIMNAFKNSYWPSCFFFLKKSIYSFVLISNFLAFNFYNSL